MKPWAQYLVHGLRAGAAAVFSVVLWSVWLALALLLVVQLYVVSSNELTLPEFALRRIEDRLAASGLRAMFRHTTFDPKGRILIEDARIFLPEYTDPVLTVRSIFIRLNPLALITGTLEPTEVRVEDAVVLIPALLSPSGRPEEIVRRLNLTLAQARGTLQVHELSAWVAGVSVNAHGAIALPPRGAKAGPEPLAAVIARQFPGLCEQAVALGAAVARVEEPSLQLDLSSTEAGALRIDVTALARAVTLTEPLAVQASQIRATTSFLVLDAIEATRLAFEVRELQLPHATVVRGLHAIAYGRLGDARGGATVEFRELEVTADSLVGFGGTVDALSARVFPRPLPRFETALVANVLAAPLALRAAADLAERSATVRFEGAISPTVLDLISERAGTNVRRFYDFDSLSAERAEARFGAGWKFEKLTAEVRVPRMNSYGVIMEDGRATVELQPDRFFSPEAYARVGEYFARGTYEHDLTTHRYRFLLDGRLRPLAISAWFGDWWPNFFKQLEFPAAPPDASVDVAGVWRDGRQSAVFVFADVPKPVLRGTALDRVRTRLFIRPAFFDGLEILATHGEGAVRGRFTLLSNPLTHDWQKFDFALDSTLGLDVGTRLLGPAIAKFIAPIRLSAPPELKLVGTFGGPGEPKPGRDHLRIEARTMGDFHYHQFPLEDASFILTLDGDEVVLDNIGATFAGGEATGHARVWGQGPNRRLGFDLALQDATLGQVAGKLSGFFAAQKGQPAPPPGKFVQEKANVRLDIAASAEGRYGEPFSFRGDGNASLRGAEIGEVALLGTLSELLKFTALRFTEARTNFKIDGPKLVFPQLELRGANSTIDAHGEYRFDRRELDFNAKVFPFQESASLLKSVVGAVLTPLSNAFEVKLTGPMDKPAWSLVLGPANFLRALSENGEPAGKPAGAAKEETPAATTPAPTPPSR